MYELLSLWSSALKQPIFMKVLIVLGFTFAGWVIYHILKKIAEIFIFILVGGLLMALTLDLFTSGSLSTRIKLYADQIVSDVKKAAQEVKEFR